MSTSRASVPPDRQPEIVGNPLPLPITALAWLGLFFSGIAIEMIWNGRFAEGVFLLGVGVLCLVRFRQGRIDRPETRLVALTVFLLLGYKIWTGGGGGFAILWLYDIPLFAFVFLGVREGFFWSALAGGFPILFLRSPNPVADGRLALDFLVVYTLVTLLTFFLEASRHRSFTRLQKQKEALEEALEHVETLRGLFPVCTQCNKMRDDEGFWQGIEDYLIKHSQARFSHGLCDECARGLYPDLFP